MGHGLMIREMRISIWSSPKAIWDILSLCCGPCLAVAVAEAATTERGGHPAAGATPAAAASAAAAAAAAAAAPLRGAHHVRLLRLLPAPDSRASSADLVGGQTGIWICLI
jgi:hypothetical protein